MVGRTSKIAVSIFLAALATTPALLAQEETPRPQEEPTPAAPQRDELRLTSGELLGGEIVQLKDGKLKFKSKDLGEQVIPFEKVSRLSMSKAHKLVLKDGEQQEVLEGRAEGEGAELRVTPAEGEPRTIARGDLVGINPDPEKTELDYWSFAGTLGITLTYGNTRTQTVGVLAGVAREDDWTKLALGYASTWGVSGDAEIAKNHRGDGQFDVKITDRFFVTPFVGHALYDKFQNIKLRYRVGFGAGYKILTEDHLKWSVEGGFAYSFTDRRDRIAGKPDKTYETSIRGATRFHYDVNDAVTIDLFYEIYVGAKNVKDTVHRATAGVTFKLIKGLALSIATIYDRIERPGRAADGDHLKKDDLKAIIGFSVALP